MKKVSKGKQIYTYPMCTVIVGTMVNDKPNFMTVGWMTRVNLNPPMLGIGVNKLNLTHQGILANKTFSINVPSSKMLAITDYCGIVSGKKVDKSTIFNTFYGKTGAPMIEECPINIECSLSQTIELPTNYFFIADIEDSYCQENCITESKIDIQKIDPILLTMPDNNYWSIGNQLGKAWSVGKDI